MSLRRFVDLLFVSVICISTLVLASCGGNSNLQTPKQVSSTSSPSTFLYVASSAIYGWTVSADGTLTAISGFPFHKARGAFATGVSANLNGSFVFASGLDSQQNSTVSTMRVEDNGLLTEVAESQTGFNIATNGSCDRLATDPYQVRTFASCTQIDEPVGLMDFSIQADGEIAGPSFLAARTFADNRVEFTKDGKFAYAPWVNKFDGYGIDGLRHNADGSWSKFANDTQSLLPEADYLSAHFGEGDVAGASYLIVPYSYRPVSSGDEKHTIAVLRIDDQGSLVELSSLTESQEKVEAVHLNREGTVLYAANASRITAYDFHNGVLSSSGIGDQSGSYRSLSIHRNLLFALAADHVSVYSLQPNGRLTLTSSASIPALPPSRGEMAIVER